MSEEKRASRLLHCFQCGTCKLTRRSLNTYQLHDHGIKVSTGNQFNNLERKAVKRIQGANRKAQGRVHP